MLLLHSIPTSTDAGLELEHLALTCTDATTRHTLKSLSPIAAAMNAPLVAHSGVQSQYMRHWSLVVFS